MTNPWGRDAWKTVFLLSTMVAAVSAWCESPRELASQDSAFPPIYLHEVFLPSEDKLLLEIGEQQRQLDSFIGARSARVTAQSMGRKFLLIYNLSTNSSQRQAVGDRLRWACPIYEDGDVFYDSGAGWVRSRAGGDDSAQRRLANIFVASFDGYVLQRKSSPRAIDRVGQWLHVERYTRRVSSMLPPRPPQNLLCKADMTPVATIEGYLQYVSPPFGDSPRLFCAVVGNRGSVTRRMKVFSLAPFEEIADYAFVVDNLWFFKNTDPNLLTVVDYNYVVEAVRFHVLDANRYESEDKQLALTKIDEISPEAYWECAGEFLCWTLPDEDLIYVRPLGHPEVAPKKVPFDLNDFRCIRSSASGTRLIAWNDSAFAIWQLGETIEQIGLFTINKDATGMPVVARVNQIPMP